MKKQPQYSLEEITVAVEWTTAALIPCTAKADFQVGPIKVKQGQRFFLARSERFIGCYYVVVWSESRVGWECSCPAAGKAHNHVNRVREHVKVCIAKKVAEKVQECQAVAPVENDQPERPVTLQEWKEATKRQKAATKAYNRKTQQAAKEVADFNRQVSGAS